MLAPSTKLLITQSVRTERNRHPDPLHPCLTPDFTSNQICSSVTIHNGTCAITVHDLHHSHDLCRYSIAPHDLSESVSVYAVEGLLVVHETKVEFHSATCSIIFLNTKICSVVFLPFLKAACSPINSASVPATILLIRTLRHLGYNGHEGDTSPVLATRQTLTSSSCGPVLSVLFQCRRFGSSTSCGLCSCFRSDLLLLLLI